jgi:RNA-directed DNA polymerase
MDRWSPQQFLRDAKDAEPQLLPHMLAIGKRIVGLNRDVQPVFTLKHLAVLSEVEYGFLRQTIARRTDSYTSFRIQKRPGPDGERRYRTICVPSPALMRVQRWIVRNVLLHVPAHDASVAFSKGDKLYKAVEPHCAAKWLIKLDIRSFFESISEASVYRVFESLGFQPLISFEMARLCTRASEETVHRSDIWLNNNWNRRHVIPHYTRAWQGHLPQGAPTSPMLANLACRDLDERLTSISEEFSMQYTRYADDMTFSSPDHEFGRKRASEFVGKAREQLALQGLQPNWTKTSVTSPGGRKVVLGLGVEEESPRLPKQFKGLIRQHLHYMLREDVGVARHAAVRGFTSITGLRHHLEGLLGFAGQIEPEYAARQRATFQRVQWPL